MVWVYLALILVALGGGAYGVRSYNLAIEEATEAKAKTAEFASAYDKLAAGVVRLQDATNKANELAAKRNGRAIAAERGRDEARRELDKLKEGNRDVKSWADTPVPDAVRLSLGSSSAASAGDLPAAGDSGSKPDAKP